MFPGVRPRRAPATGRPRPRQRYDMDTTTPHSASHTSARRAGVGPRAVRWAAIGFAIVIFLACWATVAVPTFAQPASAPPVPQTVRIDTGEISGLETESGLEFRGVPFAAAPTGELRWKPPQAVAPWTGVRDAVTYSPVCPQAPPSPNGQSEDCLYLNVTVPERATTSSKLPVIVWIHGGGFELGEGADYEAPDLSAKGAIVVTINYRLGLLGFLAHPALAEKPGGASGNYGLMDQQEALRWVQRNIAQFGGNPGAVTIAGQSAGGLSVFQQLVSPGAKGLFHRAVAQSGAFAPSQKTLADAQAEGAVSASAVGCADQSAECLRQVPVDVLVANQPLSVTPGVIDGAVVPRSIGKALATGQFNRVPIINGVNTQENRLFTTLYEAGLTKARR